MKKKEWTKKRSLLAAAAALALVLSGAIPAFAGPVSNQAGFEGDDGNLAPAARSTSIGTVSPPLVGRAPRRAERPPRP
jgi:hypothetical protein